MQRTSRQGAFAVFGLLSAGLIGLAPTAAHLPALHQQSVRLTTAGEINFPEVDWNDLTANTTANWDGLVQMFEHTTAIYSLPDAVYTQGLQQVLADFTTDLQELAKYSAAVFAYESALAAQHGALNPTEPLPPVPTFPDLFNDPVLNPVSLITLTTQNAVSSGFGMNALEVGATGIYQNMLPSINDIYSQLNGITAQFQALLSGGSFSPNAITTDLNTIGTDLTAIGKFLSLAPSTLLNDYLNGFQVQSAAPDPLSQAVPSIGDAYTLNAPFTSSDNVSITPEFGLLTNPFSGFTTDTSGFGDGTSSTFLGSSPLETGTLASLLQTEQTLSDELLTVTSTVPGSGVTAPAPTGDLTVLGPDTLHFDVNLANIPVLGPILDTLNNTIIPGINGALTTAVTVTNDAIGAANTAIGGLSTVINDTVNPFISAIDDVADFFDLPTIGHVTVDIPSVPTIPLSDIPSITPIDTQVNTTYDLPDVTEPGVPAYVMDLSHNEMALLGSFAGLAAPVTGVVDSTEYGNFLAPEPLMNLGTIFDATMASLLSIIPNDPVQITATLPLDWTNLMAETLQSLFAAG